MGRLLRPGLAGLTAGIARQDEAGSFPTGPCSVTRCRHIDALLAWFEEVYVVHSHEHLQLLTFEHRDPCIHTTCRILLGRGGHADVLPAPNCWTGISYVLSRSITLPYVCRVGSAPRHRLAPGCSLTLRPRSPARPPTARPARHGPHQARWHGGITRPRCPVPPASWPSRRRGESPRHRLRSH